MDTELKEQLLKILTELPNENSYLDYKEAPYKQENMAEFIKDVCAFLNCTESYEKDKFIIIGVIDKSRYKKGINENPMLDDKYFQDLCDFIQPRPHIETGDIEFDGIKFGYIYISKDNTDRVYSIAKDYPQNIKIQESPLPKRVYASTAYIRRGSVKYLLDEYERREIYEQDRKRKEIKEKNIIKDSNEYIDDKYIDILKICALFGTWNEENESEKKIISDNIGKEYKEWIKEIKRLAYQKSKYITYKNSVWKIENREELITKYSSEYFNEDIRNFRESTIEIVKENSNRYSKKIKKSVLEVFAFIKSISNNFVNAENEINNSLCMIVREVLKGSTLDTYENNNDILLLLAEINGEEYLEQLKSFTVKRNYNEKINLNCASGIFWGLELLAWNSQNLMQVFEILCKLNDDNGKNIDEMARIILPWYPQTYANVEFRIATVKMILREFEDSGWKVLMKLTPYAVQSTMPTCKPKWNNLENEIERKNSLNEINEEYENYVKLAIEYTKINVSRVLELIDVLQNVKAPLFDLICKKIISQEIKKLSEEDRYVIWNKLEDMINKNKKYAEKDWTLDKECLEKLEKISKEIKPKKEEIYYKRFFNRNYWDLFDNDTDTYDNQEKKILKKQIDIIESIYNKGIDEIINFSKNVNDKYRVGICLGKIKIKFDEERKILDLLNEEFYEVAEGYVNIKFNNESYSWLNNIDSSNISMKGKVRLLLQLPDKISTWNTVKEWLNEDESQYWKKTEIRYVSEENDYNYAIEKLLNVNRSDKALELISKALYEHKKILIDLVLEALKENELNINKINYIDRYNIRDIIKYLQTNCDKEEELIKIEWIYLDVLDKYNDCIPITLEKKLSKDVNFFVKILCLTDLSYEEIKNNKKLNQEIINKAYRLLDIWEVVPGTEEDGYVNGEKIKKWYYNMIEITKKINKCEKALSRFGHVLYYAKEDKDGFWISRDVAEILNKEGADIVRRGYYIEAHNSLGVVNIDKDGTAFLTQEERWQNKAEKTDMEYFRFAKTLRELAKDYHSQAEHVKENYFDF